MAPYKLSTVQANIGSSSPHAKITLLRASASVSIETRNAERARLDGWTVGVKLAANSRLKAVYAIAGLLHVGVSIFDRVEHRLRVGRQSHGFCFLIDPVANERIVPTGLFQ